MAAKPPSEDKVRRVLATWITNRGPQRAWERMANICGFASGKNLEEHLRKWTAFYGLQMPPHQYPSMTHMERLQAERGAVNQSPITAAPYTDYTPVESYSPPERTAAGQDPLLDEYVTERKDTETELEYPKPRGHFPVPPGFARDGDMLEFVSDENNGFTFGVISDTHLGSKYCRMDVLNALYDRFEAAGVQHVLHAGNWIDGYLPKINHHDLVDGCHTIHGQIRYLVANYPSRPGITTYAITGDDHEGWWARKEGLDIGGMAQSAMREAGREDWVDLGYMEAHIRLVNAHTGASTIGSVIHPGGGTSYAISYHPQKYVESLEGGEKPSFVVVGHLHKMGKFNIRNVWVLLAGCTQDSTPFIRLKVRQEIHIGGMIVHFEQDPETGALVGCGDKMLRYFVKGYYNNRWNKAGPVTLPARTPGGM